MQVALDIDGTFLKPYEETVRILNKEYDIPIRINELNNFEYNKKIENYESFDDLFTDIMMREPLSHKMYWDANKYALEVYKLQELHNIRSKKKPLLFLTARHEKFKDVTIETLKQYLSPEINFEVICCGNSDNKVDVLINEKIRFYVDDSYYLFENYFDEFFNTFSGMFKYFLITRNWNINYNIKNTNNIIRINSLGELKNNLFI